VKKEIDRRSFLKTTAITGAVVALGCKKDAGPASAPADVKPEVAAVLPPKAAPTARTRVVLVRDANVLDPDGKVVPSIIGKMLDDGVTALVGEPDPKAAWAKLLSPTDVLGIKTNRWKYIPTPPELEEAIQKRALAVGIKPEAIAIDDQGVLENPVFLKATALVNVRTLRTHHWSGIGSCLKNYIMFDPEPSRWHDDSCANLAGLWSLPIVAGKTRLNIQVLLTPLFHGKGPQHFQAEYTWAYRGLVLGTDPVAVDATALRVLEAKRKEHFGAIEPFAVPPKHVQVAQDKYGLGIADAARIDLVKLGWAEGVLL
jgi:hypothetical protein